MEPATTVQPSAWREFHLGLWAMRVVVLGNLSCFFTSLNARRLTFSSRRKRKVQCCPPIHSGELMCLT